MATTLVPYLVFDGKTTSEAMNFYKEIFGGELISQTFGEAGVSHTEEDKDLIIHSELKADGFSFMASTGHPGETVKFGDNISMSLIGEDEDQLTEWFNKLAEGGKVILPLGKQFWGDTYGQLTDKFGINWSVNIGKGEPPTK